MLLLRFVGFGNFVVFYMLCCWRCDFLKPGMLLSKKAGQLELSSLSLLLD